MIRSEVLVSGKRTLEGGKVARASFPRKTKREAGLAPLARHPVSGKAGMGRDEVRIFARCAFCEYLTPDAAYSLRSGFKTEC